jgi:transcription termination/antitermination protein NusG
MSCPVSDGAELYLKGSRVMATTSNESMLFAESNSRPERWFVVYTCANHERRVEAQFEARGVRHFLPVYNSVRRWSDRRIQLKLPLFPGYIFTRMALEEKLRVLQVPGVVKLVGFNGQPYPLLDQEVESLRLGLSQGLRIEPHPYLKVGRRVRILRGPLQGAEGILLRRKNIHRVVLSLDLIARSAAVEVDPADLGCIS